MPLKTGKYLYRFSIVALNNYLLSFIVHAFFVVLYVREDVYY